MNFNFNISDILVYILLYNVYANGQHSCETAKTCEDIHMTNEPFQRMLKERCAHKDSFISSTRNITYTHIPKSGGSTLNQILATFMRERVTIQLHEPFQLSIQRQPDNLYITLLREPVSRAISLYSYINQRKELSGTVKKNSMWLKTFNSDPAKWSADPEIIRILREDVIAYFNSEIYDKSERAIYYNHTKHIEEDKLLPSAVTISQEEFLSYTLHMPPKYQCLPYINVIWDLLRSYAVIGVVEKYTPFLTLLQQRTQLNNKHFLFLANTIHKNPSNYKKLGVYNMTILYENLKDKFYCDTILWKIAAKINEADLLC